MANVNLKKTIKSIKFKIRRLSKENIMSNYIIGIDGGGSHTEGVLCSDTGDVIKSAVSGPSSATGTEFPDAITNINTVISTLVAALPQNAHISCLFAGISGCGGEEVSAGEDCPKGERG